MNNSKQWNKAECLEFLRRFDAFEHKYLLWKNEDNEAGTGTITARWEKDDWEKWNKILNAQSHGFSGHNLSCEEEAEAALGIKQVYRDESHYTNEYLEMINLVRDKFIYDYTGIKGICDFFSPAYFEYEWGMHLEINYDKHESKFYRDHYVHQIRNLFEMFSLLDNFGYYKKCKQAYESPGSRIGTYIAESIEQEILALHGADIKLYKDMLCLTSPGSPSSRHGTCEITEADHTCLKDMMLHYIIYSATIIASLTHDIGYPLSYIRRISGRLGKYLPISQLFSSVNRDYTAIERSLQNSLLFNLVPSEKIKVRLDSEDEHGVQSAIVLLMYFCEHGQTLSKLQRCAIELAAVVVYNHTNKFAIIDESKVGRLESIPDFVRSDIHKEPLSHIFRMCDDLQEWDRVYFEITDKSNIMICSRCKTPITRKTATDIDKPERKKYFCCCSGEEQGLYDTNWFVNRRILNVIGCDNMYIDQIGKTGKVVATKFRLDYDCGALLNIMTFSKTYAMVRAEAIKKIKKLHSYQGQYDSILVESFVSGNPFVVKIKIIEEAEKYAVNIDGDATLNSFLSGTKEDQKETIKNVWKHNIEFYRKLKKEAKDIEQTVKQEIEKCAANDLGFNTTNPNVLKKYEEEYESLAVTIKTAATGILKKLVDSFPVLANDTVFALACDYIMQQAHLVGYEEIFNATERAGGGPVTLTGKDTRAQNLYRQFYENLYCSNMSLCDYVEKYISRDAYEEVKETCRQGSKKSEEGSEKKNDTVDFFVDYALFIKIWEEVKETRSSMTNMG